MEIIILLILIIFFLFYLNGSVRNQEALQRLHQKLNITSKEISELKERLKAQESVPPVSKQTPPPVKEPLPEFKETPEPVPQKEEERSEGTSIPPQPKPVPHPAYLYEK